MDRDGLDLQMKTCLKGCMDMINGLRILAGTRKSLGCLSHFVEKLDAKGKSASYFSFSKEDSSNDTSNFFRQSILYFLEKQAVDLSELQTVMQEKRLEKKLNTVSRYFTSERIVSKLIRKICQVQN